MKKYITKDDIIFGEFKLTDLFELSKGKGSVITNNGEYPLITASTSNNGKSGKSDIWIAENCFTITANGNCGIAFFHPYKFNANNDAIIAEPKFKASLSSMLKIEKWLTCFISPNYRYGRKFNLTRAKEETICLPIKNNTIDWEYIHNLGKKHLMEVLEDEKFKINNDMKNIDSDYSINNELKLKPMKKYITKDDIIFGEFKLTDLFELSKGSVHVDGSVKPGDYKLISSKITENGCTATSDTWEHENCFTIITYGDAGKALWHPYKFIAKDSLVIAKPKFKASFAAMLKIEKWLTDFIYPNYRYGWPFSLSRAKKETICLPIKNNTIDWEYIHNLGKKHLMEVLNKELEFINNKIETIDQLI
jgi:hypothetical protein